MAVWRIDIDRAAANALARAHGTALVEAVTRATFIRGNVTTPHRSGRLRAGNRMSVEQRPGRVVGEVYNDTPYAAIVHEGSRPHIIVPRRKRLLRFKVGGRVVFARKVRHPGAKAQPWLYNALVAVATAAGFRVTRR